ncbi:hypothetical protein B9Z55_007942 [Caenorhabditis nigoni]|uniref:BTB domain-containing protein n=1 Tax=Caenorhabditis nigoni TaxID=1611254 RepID=A0A2G5VCK1_9PELO|nr:hypothetical protein B9Z55_007942 [Caenorhabditis nigoni]
MSNNKEKEFMISHVYNNLSSLKIFESRYGDTVEHFGAKWKIGVFKDSDGDLRPHIDCEGPQTGNYSINTVYDILVSEVPFRTGWQFEFDPNQKRYENYIPKNDYSKYGIDESVTIEYRVKIIEMTGIEQKPVNIQNDMAKKSSEVEKIQKSMNFDDDVAKESSDIVLLVGDHKFYLSKLYLSFHSTYFKSLFLGKFAESQKSEIELKDIDPDDFQKFLEVLYGERCIEDCTCSQILSLSDYFGAKTMIRRCEEFLINASKKPQKEKFEAAVQYKMDKLTKKCIFEMKTREEIRSMIPEDPNEMDKWIWKELLKKSLTIS